MSNRSGDNTTNASTEEGSGVTTSGSSADVWSDEVERVTSALRGRLDSHDESRRVAQEKLHTLCEEWRRQADELEDSVNSELEIKFKEEDSRLQAALNNLQASALTDNGTKIAEALRKARAELLVVQRYDVRETRPKHNNFFKRTGLATENEIDAEWLDCSKPEILSVKKTSPEVTLCLTGNGEQERVVTEKGFNDVVVYKALLQKREKR